MKFDLELYLPFGFSLIKIKFSFFSLFEPKNINAITMKTIKIDNKLNRR